MGSVSRGTTRVGSRTRSAQTPFVEEIVPSSAWTEDSKGHYLLVDLPGFKKEQVKLHIDSYGRIIVKGERQTNERKRVHFNLTFPVPLDSDTDKVTGKFDSEILYVTVPKQTPQEHTETEAEQAANGNVERAEENEHQEQQKSMIRNAVSVLRKNRGIVITAVVAFSLGYLVSRKFG